MPKRFQLDERVVLTLLDAEVSHDEDDGVSGEDVVAAVDVLPVDTQPAFKN